MEQKQVLSTEEVCREFGISAGTLSRLRHSGKLRGERFGRQVKYLRRVIEAFLSGDASGAAVRPRAVLPVVPKTIR